MEPDVIEELHKAANILLYHWHYYNRERDMSKLEFDSAPVTKECMVRDEFEFVKSTWIEMKLKGKDPLPVVESRALTLYCLVESGEIAKIRQCDMRWENPLFWISYMFDKKFHPFDGFSTRNPNAVPYRKPTCSLCLREPLTPAQPTY